MLVNNAGISMNGFDVDVARGTTEVNFLGPLRVTEALLPLVPAGGTIVMVSSGMGELAGVDEGLRARFTDSALTRDGLVALVQEFVADVAAGLHGQRGWPSSGYRVSKIALNALVRVWAPALEARQIIINAVCPGWVRTDMGGRGASRSVEKGAASIVWAATRRPASPPAASSATAAASTGSDQPPLSPDADDTERGSSDTAATAATAAPAQNQATMPTEMMPGAYGEGVSAMAAIVSSARRTQAARDDPALDGAEQRFQSHRHRARRARRPAGSGRSRRGGCRSGSAGRSRPRRPARPPSPFRRRSRRTS